MARPSKDSNSLAEVGTGQLATDFILYNVGEMPAEEYSKPKCVTALLPKMHFEPRNVKPVYPESTVSLLCVTPVHNAIVYVIIDTVLPVMGDII